MAEYRKILHCTQEGSDKVYILQIDKVGDEYVLMTTWGGRRNPNLSTQCRGSFKSLTAAKAVAERIAKGKCNKATAYHVASSSLDIAGLKNLAPVKTIVGAQTKPNTLESVVQNEDSSNLVRSIKI